MTQPSEEERKFAVEEVESVPAPPRARVDDAVLAHDLGACKLRGFRIRVRHAVRIDVALDRVRETVHTWAWRANHQHDVRTIAWTNAH